MKYFGLITFLLFSQLEISFAAFNERMAVQGYLKSGTSGLTTGTYNMRFTIKKAGSSVWAKAYTGANKVSVTDGMFTQILSGADDSAVALSGTLLDLASSSDIIVIDVVVDVTGDGLGVGTDATFSNLDIVPAPMSLISKYSSTLLQNGASDGQFLMWDSGSSTWIPSNISSSNIPSGAITNGLLADGSVTTIKLADTSISTIKLIDSSVTAAKLSTNSVTTAKISDASVTTAKLADNSITASKIPDGSITSLKYATGSVDATAMAASSVDLAGPTVTGSLPVANGGTGLGSYAIGNITYASAATTLSPLAIGTNGQVLTVSAGLPSWQTPTLTVSSANTWTSTNQFNGGLGVGTAVTGGSNLTNLKVCSGAVGAFNVATAGTGITNTLTCTGVTTAMAVSCSPTAAPTQANNPWWSAFVSATNTISIRVVSTAVTGTEMAAATWRCLVF